MNKGPALWLAVWNVRCNFAYALEGCPEELEAYERSLRNARLGVATTFAGPFTSQRQAKDFAVEKLVAGIKGHKRLSTRRAEAGSK